MAKRKKKNVPTTAAVVGRMGTEAFISLINRPGGAMKTGKRDISRQVAKRRALAEW
jgi:hypothetical protein